MVLDVGGRWVGTLPTRLLSPIIAPLWECCFLHRIGMRVPAMLLGGRNPKGDKVPNRDNWLMSLTALSA